MRHWSALPLLLLIPGCSFAEGESPAGEERAAALADPAMARALHAPLMSDPDLSSRNEANALIGFADSAALPVLPATSEAAAAARDAARLELLEGGPLPELPAAAAAPPAGPPLPPQPATSAKALLAALGSDPRCASALKPDFALAADPPAAAAIMPHGMAIEAAGASTGGCALRILRYRTPAVPEDVLQYHYVRQLRAGLAPSRAEAPAAIIGAGPKGAERAVVLVYPGTAKGAKPGLTTVTILHRAR